MDIHDLQLQRARLEHRLMEGYERIEAARARGQDVTAWEDFWSGLLAEYERLCDAEPAGQQTLFSLTNVERFTR